MNYNNNSNTVQTAWLGIGSLVSFSFGIVSAAILSRYLTKPEYGTYKQVLYVYGTLLMVFSLGLPKAYSYFLARAPMEEGRSIIRKMNGLLVWVGLFFALVLYCTSSLFADVLSSPDLKDCLRLFSVTPLFLLPILGIESLMVTYKKAYIYTAYTIFSRLFTLLCVVTPVVLFDASVHAAVGGFVFSSLLCCLSGLYLERYLFRNIQKTATAISIREILRFSIPLSVASFWGIIIKSANQFFISRYWGNEVFAEFSNGFIELPFAHFVIGAAATVLLPVFSKKVYDNSDPSSIIDLWKSVAIKSAKIIFPLTVFSFFFAEPIMIFVYGKQYADSAVYFRIIAVVNLVRIVPYAPVMLALGKSKDFARIHMLTAIMIVVMEYLCVRLFPSPYIIALISVSCTIFCLGLLLRCICKYMNISAVELIPYRSMGMLLVLSLAASVLSKSVSSLLPDISAMQILMVSFVVFAVVYLCLCKYAGISYIYVLNYPLRKCRGK